MCMGLPGILKSRKRTTRGRTNEQCVSINDKENKEPVYGPLDLGEEGKGREGETSWGKAVS